MNKFILIYILLNLLEACTRAITAKSGFYQRSDVLNPSPLYKEYCQPKILARFGSEAEYKRTFDRASYQNKEALISIYHCALDILISIGDCVIDLNEINVEIKNLKMDANTTAPETRIRI